MKRKFSFSKFTLLCVAPMIVALASCGNEISNSDVHTHSFNETYSHDDEYHWKECTIEGCSEISEKETHTYDGDNDSDCNVCGYVREGKENKITFTIAERTYNKKAQELKSGTDFNVEYGTPVVSYKKKDEADDKYTSTAPINAGLYTVKVTVEGNALYKKGFAKTDFEIKPIELTNLSFNKEYDKSNHIEVTLDSSNGVLEGDSVSINIRLDDETAGKKSVVSATCDNTNYNLSLSSIDCSITKKVVTLKVGNASIYDGNIYKGTSLPNPKLENSGVPSGTSLKTSYFKYEANNTLKQISLNDVTKEIGKYRIEIQNEVEDKNYIYQFVKDFEVKEIESLKVTDGISLSKNSTKDVLMDLGSQNRVFKLGYNGKISIKFFKNDKVYGCLNSEVNNRLGDSSFYVGGDGVVLARITSQVGFSGINIFDDVTWKGSSENYLQTFSSSNTLTPTTENPFSGKVICAYFSIDDNEGEGSYYFEWDSNETKTTVYASIDNGQYISVINGSIHELYDQGSYVNFYIVSAEDSAFNFRVRKSS
ncbi:MAG TPA: hypothetical protein DDW20_06015 [Firmicutes bacterium]|nr:hypothetical protein [Bacillota bacterium]